MTQHQPPGNLVLDHLTSSNIRDIMFKFFIQIWPGKSKIYRVLSWCCLGSHVLNYLALYLNWGNNWWILGFFTSYAKIHLGHNICRRPHCLSLASNAHDQYMCVTHLLAISLSSVWCARHTHWYYFYNLMLMLGIQFILFYICDA